MSNTFITWLLGAAVAGLGLALLLATPVQTDTAATPSAAANGAAPATETVSYWQSVGPAPSTAAATSVVPSAPCTTCSTHVESAYSTASASAVSHMTMTPPTLLATPSASVSPHRPSGSSAALTGMPAASCGAPAVACG